MEISVLSIPHYNVSFTSAGVLICFVPPCLERCLAYGRRAGTLLRLAYQVNFATILLVYLVAAERRECVLVKGL
jgi:hypothetical protein